MNINLIKPVFAASILLFTACNNTGSENNPANDAKEEKQVSFELGEMKAEEELHGLPYREWFLVADEKKWPLGRLEGSAELVPKTEWNEHQIPENALAVLHNYHGGDFYYFAVRENGRLVIYNGGPYIDEKDGELKYIYDERIEPMLLGRWEAKGSPENWVFYDAHFYFMDSYEDGISYRVIGDTLFTGMGDAQLIEKLTEKEFIARDVEGTYKNHWVKVEKK